MTYFSQQNLDSPALIERKVYWQAEPTGDYSACVAGQVEMFRDLHELRVYLSMTYPDTVFELVEVTEDTWQGFYDQGVFFDDWS
ncbi:hypothetical protein K3H50_17920 [Aeromonas veronii]|uniref:Uncharacterized protein n=1 Tax=Aeromonas veronii TaxID=654 RepID=A0AAX2UMD5_AERVE|nr:MULTISPECIES: hypothetical protein [Aeromonas]MBE8735703.1 hypothetical protein [Aeromonas veronii]MBE8739937.1 hypothetical protein [Aeromonas veronii]MBE8743557.1 hypothetical protein [Aeromonas veronii]MBE8764919.1 hypothetical protein [Aeromonas veronii]MBE8839104.1 hypothetical protein [Aeromonas veronii]